MLGAVLDSCQNSEVARRAISTRLRQQGTDTALPKTGVSQCLDLDCAAKLKGQPGLLMGGQVSGEHSYLWLADLARDQVLISRHVGKGADKPDSLARQAAVLAERAHDQQAPWLPRELVPLCREPAADTKQTSTDESQATGGTDAGPLIAMAVHAPPAVGKYAAVFQKGVRRSLLEMGIQVREVHGLAPPANPRDALPGGWKELPLVDVQLLTPEHAQRNATPDGAVIRLSDGRHATQSSIDCGSQDCEPGQLVQFVRRNVALLVDRVAESAEPDDEKPATTATVCRPADPCKPQDPNGKPAPTSEAAAATSAAEVSRDPAGPVSGGTAAGVPRTTEGMLANHAAKVLPFYVGGGISLFLSAAGLATGIGLAAIQGHPHQGVTCGYHGSTLLKDCVWDNVPLITIGFIGGAALVTTGGILLWQARKRGTTSSK